MVLQDVAILGADHGQIPVYHIRRRTDIKTSKNPLVLLVTSFRQKHTKDCIINSVNMVNRTGSISMECLKTVSSPLHNGKFNDALSILVWFS